MKMLKNERGAVLIWITLMIVLLIIMVGMGLDTGNIVYSRATGQAAVDAAALNAITALPQAKATTNPNLVYDRAKAFIATNDYTGSGSNQIGNANVSFVQYNYTTDTVTNYNEALGVANGVRVALEQTGGNDFRMKTPAFLTPLLKLFGSTANATNNVSVSAVSVMSSRPSIPIALWSTKCSGTATVPDVEIRQQPPGSENSCWTTYLDKSSGAKDVQELFQASATCDGIPMGAIDIGIPIYENKGQQASDYDEAKTLFITNHPGRCWIIPVINPPVSGNCNEKNPTPIVDWAEICPTQVSKGSDKFIKASVTCGKRLEQSTASLCFSNRLVREHSKGM